MLFQVPKFCCSFTFQGYGTNRLHDHWWIAQYCLFGTGQGWLSQTTDTQNDAFFVTMLLLPRDLRAKGSLIEWFVWCVHSANIYWSLVIKYLSWGTITDGNRVKDKVGRDSVLWLLAYDLICEIHTMRKYNKRTKTGDIRGIMTIMNTPKTVSH